VATLLAVPQAEGLFAQAISDSPANGMVRSAEAAAQFATQFATLLAPSASDGAAALMSAGGLCPTRRRLRVHQRGVADRRGTRRPRADVHVPLHLRTPNTALIGSGRHARDRDAGGLRHLPHQVGLDRSSALRVSDNVQSRWRAFAYTGAPVTAGRPTPLTGWRSSCSTGRPASSTTPTRTAHKRGKASRRLPDSHGMIVKKARECMRNFGGCDCVIA
jgi:carboxylesterase type B